jgi:hypothetical protein
MRKTFMQYNFSMKEIRARFKFYVQTLLLYKRIIFPKLASKQYILTRTACLGTDVVKTLNLDYKIFNMQKNRIDLLVEQIHEPQKLKLKFEHLKTITDDSIRMILLHQLDNRWSKRSAPTMLIMDSFSELTDQKFIFCKSNQAFWANYNDVDRESITRKEVSTEGLLAEKQIYEKYKNFFLNLIRIWPETPIFFISFPTKFDSRLSFKNRAKVIERAITKCQAELGNVTLIKIEESSIEEKPKDEKFIYHYSENVSKYLANEIQNSLNYISI